MQRRAGQRISPGLQRGGEREQQQNREVVHARHGSLANTQPSCSVTAMIFKSAGGLPTASTLWLQPGIFAPSTQLAQARFLPERMSNLEPWNGQVMAPPLIFPRASESPICGHLFSNAHTVPFTRVIPTLCPAALEIRTMPSMISADLAISIRLIPAAPGL